MGIRCFMCEVDVVGDRKVWGEKWLWSWGGFDWLESRSWELWIYIILYYFSFVTCIYVQAGDGQPQDGL